MVCQYGVALESRENTPVAVLSPCQLFIFMSREAHVTGQGKEQTSQAQTQVCLERQEYSQHYIFARPVPACWCILLKQHFRKKKPELGLKTSLPAFQCYKPLRQESMSLPISLQGHSLEQGHSKADSAQSCLRSLKFLSEDTIWQRMHCSFRAITKNLQTSAKPCDGLPMSILPTKRYQSKPAVGWISWHLFTNQGAENCIGESKQPRHLTLLAHIIFFYI